MNHPTNQPNNLLPSEQWKNLWNTHDGVVEHPDYSTCMFARYYHDFLTHNEKKTVIEVGAFPGRYLGYVAKNFGYMPTALEYVDDNGIMSRNMKFHGIVCNVINADFLTWCPERLYDVVLSHGFVEHFQNYEEVIEKHFEILAPNGILFLSVPMASKLKLISSFLRKGKKEYSRIVNSHVFEIMRLNRLNEICRQHKGVEILFSGRVWKCEPNSSGQNVFKYRYLAPIFYPNIMVVARKLE